MPLFWLQDSASGLVAQFPTTAVQTVTLIPGRYRFGTLVSPTFLFDVGHDGRVMYEPAFEGFLSGQGTDALEVNGFVLRIDATRLGVASFTIQDAASGLAASLVATQHQCVSLIPGDYLFSAGFSFGFSMVLPGVVTCRPELDACVRGRNTQHMRVLCDPAGP